MVFALSTVWLDGDAVTMLEKVLVVIDTGTNFTPTGTMFGVIFYEKQSIIYIRKILRNGIIFLKKINSNYRYCGYVCRSV